MEECKTSRPKGSRNRVNKKTTKVGVSPQPINNLPDSHPDRITICHIKGSECSISWSDMCKALLNNPPYRPYIPLTKETPQQRQDRITKYNQQYTRPTPVDQDYIDNALDK